MPASATARPGLLTARGVGCKRGRRTLFRDVELALAPGSVTWLRGSNGSGKTSLMRILAGLAHASEGEIAWNGAPLARARAEARRGVLYVGHANALKDDLTLAEAVAFHAALAGLDRPQDRALAAIGTLRLTPWKDMPVRALSQGQRRRGTLARLALDSVPRVWILDEPFDALDAQSVELVADVIAEHAARGGAVLITSHQPVPIIGAREFDLEPLRVQ